MAITLQRFIKVLQVSAVFGILLYFPTVTLSSVLENQQDSFVSVVSK